MHKFTDRFGSRHPAVSLVGVSKPNPFLIGNTEADADNRTLVATLQLAQPRVRDTEIARDGYGNYATGKAFPRTSETRQPAASD